MRRCGRLLGPVSIVGLGCLGIEFLQQILDLSPQLQGGHALANLDGTDDFVSYVATGSSRYDRTLQLLSLVGISSFDKFDQILHHKKTLRDQDSIYGFALAG